MNKFFCWLTGGHKYEDKNLESAYSPYTGQQLIVNRCAKCGYKHVAVIDLHALIEREVEEFKKRRRKDGADNG